MTTHITEDWQRDTGIWTGGLFPELEGYDWPSVIAYAQFGTVDIERIIAMSEGDNDGPDWILVVRLRGGKYAAVVAGCDYTGWG